MGKIKNNNMYTPNVGNLDCILLLIVDILNILIINLIYF